MEDKDMTLLVQKIRVLLRQEFKYEERDANTKIRADLALMKTKFNGARVENRYLTRERSTLAAELVLAVKEIRVLKKKLKKVRAYPNKEA